MHPDAARRGHDRRGRRSTTVRRGLVAGLALATVPWGLAADPVGAARAGAATRGAGVTLSGCSVGARARAEPSHQLPIRRLRGDRLAYCDDFVGRRLARGWFLFRGHPGGDPGALFVPSHVRQHGGLLTINTYRDRFNGGRWATGGTCLCGHPQTYGTFFVRSRVTGAGDDNDELLWPAWHVWPPEVDFNETGASIAHTGAYVHYPAGNQQIGHQLAIDLMRWHTWGVIWTPRAVLFTVDGRVWSRVLDPAAIPHLPMTLDLQEQTFCFNGLACPSRPVSLQIDWVELFTHVRR
jgi:hypothetical protein